MLSASLPTTVRPVPELARAPDQVAEYYRSEIRAGTRKPGDKFLSVRVMAAAWGISPNTALRAMRILSAEGWVEVSDRRRPVVIGVPPT